MSCTTEDDYDPDLGRLDEMSDPIPALSEADRADLRRIVLSFTDM